MASSEFVIHDDMISLVEKKVVKTVSAEAFFDTISKNKPVFTPVLPYNCRLMASNPRSQISLFVMERTPKCTPVTFCDVHNKNHKFVISLPFMQFFVMFSMSGNTPGYQGCYLSCTKKPIMSENDQLYCIPLPNQFESGNGAVCTGHIRVKTASIPVMVNELISGYFGSPFNNDLSMHYPSVIGTNDHLKAFKKWHELTEANPLFGISKDIEYTPMRCETLKKKCERLLRMED